MKKKVTKTEEITKQKQSLELEGELIICHAITNFVLQNV